MDGFRKQEPFRVGRRAHEKGAGQADFRMNSYSQAIFLIFCVADCAAGFFAFLGAELTKVVAWRRLRSLLTLGELPNRYIGSTVSNISSTLRGHGFRQREDECHHSTMR